jgi:hypothetical protein
MKTTILLVLLASAIAGIPGCRERPQQRRADGAPDQQFAVSAESAATVLGSPQFDVCSLENVRSVSDNTSNPGDAANSWKVGRGETYEVSGFAVDKAQGTVPHTIRLLLVGKGVYAVTTKTGVERPDVAQYFTWGSFSRAGYSCQVAFDDVAPGDYQVLIAQAEDNRSFLVCRTFQTITIR